MDPKDPRSLQNLLKDQNYLKRITLLGAKTQGNKEKQVYRGLGNDVQEPSDLAINSSDPIGISQSVMTGGGHQR